jgi:hypothetical protein
MQPKKNLITIDKNKERIVQLLNELVLEPRVKALAWSKITKQTPNLKIGYPGQHLVSLVVGMEGTKTGARGNDIVDGSEVKSCSRVDQLDTCKSCGEKVLRIENECSNCHSTSIKRMDDSKWLFTIRSENDLKVLTEEVERVILTIADYPNFEENDFEDIRFQVFEIWVKSHRNRHFKTLMTNYYEKIYLEHTRKNAKKVPAPKNFWPFSYQFYMCNPIKVFECIVENANQKPKIEITHFVEPAIDRSEIIAEPMPVGLLSKDEQLIIANKLKIEISDLKEEVPFINEDLRAILPLRENEKITEAKQPYKRR